MAISEEEQMAAMLAEMGVDNLDDLGGIDDKLSQENPIPAAPVSKKNASETSNDVQIENVQDNIADVKENLEDENALLNGNTQSVLEDELKRPNNNKYSRASISGSRELTIQSLVHLMGLPTGVQVSVLDTKLDLISARLGTIQSKIDRLQSQIDIVLNESQSERMEFQLTEIRSIMKKFFPTAFQSQSASVDIKSNSQHKPQILSNKTPNEKETKKETTVHVAVSEKDMEEEPLSDQDYQTIEAMKMREKSS